jgi:hypothetical protein
MVVIRPKVASSLLNPRSADFSLMWNAEGWNVFLIYPGQDAMHRLESLAEGLDVLVIVASTGTKPPSN